MRLFARSLHRSLAPSLIAGCLLTSLHAAEAVNIGSRRELFVDQALVERLSGKAELRLHRPVPREISLVHDALWEGSGSGYHSVFQDGDKYRMYYKAWDIALPHQADTERSKQVHPLFCAYAESDDGIHWRKPSLGLHEFNGSKANSIVMVSGPIGTLDVDAGHPAVFKDTNPNAAPDARYKAILRSGKPLGLLAFKSPDGLHWTPMKDGPIITDGAFDSQNLAFWDAARGEYRAYWRFFDRGTPDKPYVGVRSIRTATSKDFLNWENYADLKYPDAPPTHLYTNQIKPYHRAPHLLIGFPARYVEREQKGTMEDSRGKATPEKTKQWSPSMRALPELAHRESRAAASERYGTALTETVIMASRDGVNFKRWQEAFLPPGIERVGTWHYGHQYVAWHLVETKSDLEGAPNELSLYAVESYWTDNSSTLRRYTLRLDGFVSAHAPMAGGELVTKPIVFSGQQLTLNFASSAAGGIEVELQDASGRPLPGFTLADCPPIFGDTLERPVTWTGGADLRSLAGRAVRIRFVLRDADLYSYQFKP
ncbi:MAG TPA: hypothetical protein PKX00_09300 [Opitutaceae bacterium]|nr:hypothetical protein [Opitutaceae bacterium]